MKKLVWFVAAAVLLIGLYSAFQYFADGSLGGNYVTSKTTLMGSSADLKKVPSVYVFANSTTTDATFDGGTVNQLFATGGMDTVRLQITAIGTYATNTINIRTQFSDDGETFFDVGYATSTLRNATSTSDFIPSVKQFVVPLTTSTPGLSWDFDVRGAAFTRFLFYSPDPDGDNKERVQAFIKAVGIEPFVR